MTNKNEKEVQSLINTLGFLEKGVYYAEPDCFHNVRDLIRYLSQDDHRLFTVRRLCNGHNIVKNDLVPIMISEDTNEELFDVALRLTVNLCQPTLRVFENRRPEDAAECQIFYELENSLIRTIVAFSDARIFKIFVVKIREYFDHDWEDTSEKQRIFIERIFTLIRHVFAIGMENIKDFSISGVDHTVRERVIANFFISGIDEIFLKLSSNSMEKDFCAYVVAILALIYKTLNPRAIAHEGEAELQQKDRKELEEEQAKIIALIKTEEENKRKLSRRSFMAGTFVVKGQKALNPEKEFVIKSSLVNNENVTPIHALSIRKKPRLAPRTRRVGNLEATEECNIETLQELNPEAMLTIKQFCSRLLLEGKYNRLMRTVKDMAFNGRRQTLNELHYLTLSSFMITFVRHCHISCQHLTTTFSVEFFHQVTSLLTDCFDKMKMDKENIRKHALTAQYAVTAFREMTIMLNTISTSIFPEDKEFFKEFCHQIFQVEEYRELAAGILLHLSPAGTSHKMVQDLILANHYFLHLMEKTVKEGEMIKVLKKKRQKKRKSAQKQKQKEQAKSIENVMKMKDLDVIWQGIEQELLGTLSGENDPNEEASPLNALIKTDDEKMQQFALLQVQLALRTKKVADAVGIYRNARVLWPETGTFGEDQAPPEDELRMLKDLFDSDMKKVSKEYTEELKRAYGRTGEADELMDKDEEEEGGEGENEEESGEIITEKEEGAVEGFDDQANDNGTDTTTFDFSGFVSSMAKPVVINWYIFCLRMFRTNPKEVNLAIIKFFHRIAYDLKSPARLYLASLFTVLRQIKEDVCKSTNPDNRSQHPHFKLYEFGYYLLKKFFTYSQERGRGIMACEMLFAKTNKEAYEIEHGYGSMD